MIVVTGANGFIGAALVWQINQSQPGTPVIAVDSVSTDERPAPLAKRQVQQFLSKDELWPFLEKNAADISWVIHMGACSSTTETNEAFLKENNTEYTQRIFEWCTKNQKSLIYASSAAVYGDGLEGFSDKEPSDKYTPLNLYGESKAAFDRWVSQQDSTPPQWYGLRFFNVYGPGEGHKKDMASVVFKAFQQIKDSKKLKLFRSHREDYQDGYQERDFVYVKDITHWCMELMEQKPQSGIYNMGFGKPRPWMDLASAVFQNMGLETQIDWIDMPENIRDQYQYTTCAETQKWQEQNLSSPTWSLEKGIADYIQFLKNEEEYL